HRQQDTALVAALQAELAAQVAELAELAAAEPRGTAADAKVGRPLEVALEATELHAELVAADESAHGKAKIDAAHLHADLRSKRAEVRAERPNGAERAQVDADGAKRTQIDADGAKRTQRPKVDAAKSADGAEAAQLQSRQAAEGANVTEQGGT